MRSLCVDDLPADDVSVDDARLAGSVLVEMGQLSRSVPGVGASPVVVAAWYESKAVLFEHVAAEGGLDAAKAAVIAEHAHRHAARLLARCPS